jgi:glycosyltransferase involved in cell wall biosynthesis
VPAPGRPEYRVSLGISPEARSRLRAFDPTLVHIATPDLLGRHALCVAQANNVPVVASYHTHFSSYLKYYHLGLFEGLVWSYIRNFYRQCRHVYVPSPSVADILRERGVTDGLRLWRRGVNTETFHPSYRSSAWRQRYGVADDEVLVTFVSRLVWEKGLDTYAQVIERLEARGVPHRSMVVGDGPARKELENRLPNTIFTGHLEDEALSRAYASSDVFLFPSDTETFGNVTLEAMASGLPAVAADAVGSRDLVRDGTTGFLADPEDPEAFYTAVARLVTDDALREEFGASALEHAQEFSWETVLGAIDYYYNEALGRVPAVSGDGAAHAIPDELTPSPAPS